MNKKLINEFKKLGARVLNFYYWSRCKGRRDQKAMMVAREGDLLARDILVLISQRTTPDAEGLVAAMIAISQTYNFFKQSMPFGLDDGLSDIRDEFLLFFEADFWRWVKHDEVQYAYQRLFSGRSVDCEELINSIDCLIAREKNYKQRQKILY